MKRLILGSMPQNATPDTCLAAGPWCFCGQEKLFPNWEKTFTLAPDPLVNTKTAHIAVRAAQTLAIKSIPQIAKLLCAHSDKLPASYWQVLLAPFAMDVASQIVERSLRVQTMLAIWGQEKLQVDILPVCEFDFADEHDFTLRGSLGIQFNLWLFSRLLLENWPAQWQKVELNSTASDRWPKQSKSISTRLKEKLRGIALKMPFPKMKGMTFGSALKFSIALAMPCSGIDHSLDLRENFNFERELEQICLPEDWISIFTAALPRSLRQLRHPESLKKARVPRLRVASILAHEDAAYRQELSIWRACGNRLAYAQHGGNYGQVKTPCTAEIVEYSQEAFFTWGWKSQAAARGHFVPLPALQLCQIANAWHGAKSETLIFTGTEMSVYSHRLDSHPAPLQFVAYRQAKATFFATLEPEIRKCALYRPYFQLPGTLADADWLLPQFPEVQLCQGNLLEQILNCRILIVDHHGTTVLEAMAADVPVLLYWDRKAWPLAPECDVLINMLETAGIWHASPESAANKANEIWNNPLAWWQSAEVRMARQIFCNHQALYAKDAEAIWLRELKNL